MKKRLLVILIHLALWPVYFISLLVPKDKKLWIFGAWQGKKYSDNSKYFFEYMHQHDSHDIKCVWITKSRALLSANTQYPLYHAYSFKGIYLQIRAGAAFFTHGYDTDFTPATIAGKTIKYQLWHGSPIKKIRYDDVLDKRIHSVYWKLFIFFFPWRRWDFDFIPATSRDVKQSFETAFLNKHVYLTGYPRNDFIKRGRLDTSPRKLRKVLYAPTFRGLMGSEKSDDITSNILIDMGFDIAYITDFLESHNMCLTLRMHPSNVPSGLLLNEIKKSDSIILDDSDDIYSTLDQYDVLVTDYSSLFLDFMLTGKPVIHAPFDLDIYLESSRGMYYDYIEDIFLTPGVLTWSDILSYLASIESEGLPVEYQEKYEEISARFNSVDGEACRRIFKHAINELLN